MGTILTEITSLIGAITAFISATGVIVAVIIGHNNKGKAQDVLLKTEDIKEKVANGGTSPHN